MKKSNKMKWVWLSALVLFVCVAATSIVITDHLNQYLLDDSGAIPLIPEEHIVLEAEVEETVQEEPVHIEAVKVETEPIDADMPLLRQPERKPGFEVSDDNTVWSTDTQVEIFRVSYENGEQVITVESSDGYELIAPGTENSYTFKLKNTGNVALDYTVEVDAWFSPEELQIPITGRLSRYDGKWITGSQDAYADVPALDAAEDSETLGAGKYTYYTLDWLWPFESGNDALDTDLGNLAAEQDLTFTIVIKTTATESDDPDDDSGITPPKTGDESSLILWIALAVGSLIMLLLLIIYMKKDKQRDEAEA